MSNFEMVFSRLDFNREEILEPILQLAAEIAREGREGRRIGTILTVGDHEAVLNRSRPLILDPLKGHAPESRHISDANLQGTIKELAQLDGAFVVTEGGTFIAACRHLDASAAGIEMPLGLGSRHFAAASITRATHAVAIVVSESSVVRVFEKGCLIAQIIPELWLLRRHAVHLASQAIRGTEDQKPF